jgi:dipeptidyl aminopeptidase/acylaminoacyl peptidase
VSKGSFSNGACNGWPYFDASALAELGFIVVQLDGRGTPFREKAFHETCYGRAESANNLEDHVAGIRQLAERYPYMDLDRVGIHSLQGGPGAIQGLLHYPDFYRVGVGACTHDSRLMPSTMWGDKYEGLAGADPDYQYPEHFADQLKGKLLFMHGMLDVQNPPAAIYRVIEALQKANKDFDLLSMPTLGHAMNSYMMRRTWDYLVKHLQGIEPPKEFKLTTSWDMY